MNVHQNARLTPRGRAEAVRRVTEEQIRDAARKYLSRDSYAQLTFVPPKAAP